MSEALKFSAARWAFDLLTETQSRTVLVCDKKKITAAALHEEVSRYRASLNQASLGQDHIVAIACDRSAASVAAILACFCEGISPFLIDPRQDHDVLAKLMDAVRIHGLYCGESIKSEMFRARLPYLKWIGDSALTLQTSRASAPEGKTDGSFMLHSSGTCGLPRALQHSCSAIEWHINSLVKSLRIKSGAELWFTGNLAQSSVFSLGFCAVLSAGGVLVLDDPASELNQSARLSGEQRFLLLSQFSDSFTWTAEKLLAIKNKVTATLTTDFSLSENFAVTISQATDAPAWNGWSLAEAAGFLTVNLVPGVWPTNSVGRPLAGAQVHCIDSGNEVFASLGKLYYRHAPAPQKVISLTFQIKTESSRHGAPSEDWGRVDHSDFIFIEGCDKSVFYRAGFPIEAPAIEDRIASLAGVKENIVYAIPNEDVESDVAIAIVPANGKTEFTGSIDELSKSMPRYLLPQRISIVDSLARTPSGKYHRHGLPVTSKQTAPKESVQAPAVQTEEQGGENKFESQE
jgi:acyl-CoA synthetase (AMP-forming)/AMP-acid ligase II